MDKVEPADPIWTTLSPLLLVDDDAIFLQTLSRSVQRRGLQVLAAASEAEALALVRKQTPRAAVIDLKLGDDNGLHLIEALHRILPNIPIVMLTGYASIPTSVEAIKRGATDYLCKPVNTRDILHALLGVKLADTTEAIQAPMSVERMEWEHIQRVLQDNGGNVSATARQLNMHRRTLQRKLQKRPPRA